MILTAGVVLWWIASAVGAVHNLESFIGDLVNDPKFRFLSWEVLRGATIIGLVLVCVLVVITVIATGFDGKIRREMYRPEQRGGVEVHVGHAVLRRARAPHRQHRQRAPRAAAHTCGFGLRFATCRNARRASGCSMP